MIGDQLVLDLLGHSLDREEGSLKITLELAGGSHDVIHDLETLLLGDTRSERVTGEVSSNSDSGGNDHGGIFFGELGVGKSL